MGFDLTLYFWASLKLRFPDVEENPGPRATAPARCRALFTNINGLHGNLKELAVASSRYDIVLCAETKATTRRHRSELLLPGFAKPALISRGSRPNGLGFALYVRDGFAASRKVQYECPCCEYMVVRIQGSRQNFYLFGVYRSPSTDDRVFDCLMSAMARVQEADHRAVFCFAGDFNCHHEEWLGSPRTDCHGVAARDFASLTDCSQLVNSPTHRQGGTLDLLLTNVPDLCNVQVCSPIGNSDHSYLNIALSTNVRAPSFCVPRVVYQKSRVNWEDVESDVMGLEWSGIFNSRNVVEAFDEALLSIINARVPKITLRTRMGDQPWFSDDCRLAFDEKQEAYRIWLRERSPDNWHQFRNRQMLAKRVYAEAERQFHAEARDRLNSATSAHRWWKVLKESVLGVECSLPPLIGPGGGLVSLPREKAELFSEHFDSKQSRRTLELPATCNVQPRLTRFAFRSGEVRKFLADLDADGGSDPLGFFPLFFKRISRILAPKASRLFRFLLRSGSFPKAWRCANIIPIPKGPVSDSCSEYRPISITPVLSKVYERVVCRRLSAYLEVEGLLPSAQFAYRKGLGTLDAVLNICSAGQLTLDAGKELLLVQIDFSAAFDRVSHSGLKHKLSGAGIGGSFLSVLCEFLSQRVQRVVVDGVSSEPVDVVSGVPQGSVLGPLLFLLYTSDLFLGLDNNLVGYADDSTLMAVINNPSSRARTVESVNKDLVSISEWCAAWGMKLNPTKTKSMVISRSRTTVPPLPALVMDGVVLQRVNELKTLGVILDSRLTFEAHLRSVAAAASRTLGIMRRASRIFNEVALTTRCFWTFLLPTLEYCSPAWMSAAQSHLSLLDKVVSKASHLCGGQLKCDLSHRRKVASLCVYYKVRDRETHPLGEFLPELRVFERPTRQAAAAHRWTVELPRSRTQQCSRSFVNSCSVWWNALPASVFDGEDIDGFKRRVNRHLLALTR